MEPNELCKVGEWAPSSHPESSRSLFTYLLLVSLPGLATILGVGFLFGASIAAFLAVACVAGILGWFSRRSTTLTATPDDLDLLEPGSESWLTEVSISQDGVITGCDRGAIFFDQGMIGFVGHHMSFVLHERDIHPVGRSMASWRSGGYYRLSLKSPAHPRWARRNIYLLVRLLEYPGTSYGTEASFAQQMGEIRDEPSGLPSTYPPLWVGVGADTEQRMTTRAVLLAFVPISLIGLLFAAGTMGMMANVGIVVAFCLPLVFLLPSLGQTIELTSRLARFHHEDMMSDAQLLSWHSTPGFYERRLVPLFRIFTSPSGMLVSALTLFALSTFHAFAVVLLFPFVCALSAGAFERVIREKKSNRDAHRPGKDGV